MTVVDFTGMKRITKGRIKSGNYSEKYLRKGVSVPKGWTNRGWVGESTRHSMSAYGIKTGTKKPSLIVLPNGKFRHTKWNKNPTIVGTEAGHIATKQERKKDPYLSEDSVVHGKPKIAPMPKGTNVWDVEDPEGAGLTEKQNIQIWQHLVDTGMAWSLQGWYGRTASAMIEAGIIHKKN